MAYAVAMGKTGTMARRLRPITAVVVLYAFVLQGFLGGLLPIRMLDHAGFLCAQAADSARNGEDPIKAPAQHAAACCIAAHVAADATPPLPAMVTLVWPLREAKLPTRGPEIRVAARAPPGSIPLARGPPTA